MCSCHLTERLQLHCGEVLQCGGALDSAWHPTSGPLSRQVSAIQLLHVRQHRRHCLPIGAQTAQPIACRGIAHRS